MNPRSSRATFTLSDDFIVALGEIKKRNPDFDELTDEAIVLEVMLDWLNFVGKETVESWIDNFF